MDYGSREVLPSSRNHEKELRFWSFHVSSLQEQPTSSSLPFLSICRSLLPKTQWLMQPAATMLSLVMVLVGAWTLGSKCDFGEGNPRGDPGWLMPLRGISSDPQDIISEQPNLVEGVSVSHGRMNGTR